MHIAELPLELLSMIAKELDPLDSLRFAMTCKAVADLLQDEAMWKFQTKKMHKGLDFKDAQRSWKEVCFSRLQPWCPHLSKINRSKLRQVMEVVKSEESNNCQSCQYVGPDIWICVECRNRGCGRAVHRHGMRHYTSPTKNFSHEVVFKSISFDFWCYECERWLGCECDAVEVARIGEFVDFMKDNDAGGQLYHLRERREVERSLTELKASQRFVLVDGESFERFRQFLIGNMNPPERFTSRFSGLAMYGDFNLLPEESWRVILELYPGSEGVFERSASTLVQAQVQAIRNYLRTRGAE
jgi:hypothetical protein